MPFRDPKIYVITHDLEDENKARIAYNKRKKSKNPFMKLWWRITKADDAYFNPKRKDPPSSWKRY